MLRLIFDAPRRPVGLDVYDIPELDLESALKLSTTWNFDAVRQSALSSLEKLSLHPARAIQLAQLYGVDRWIAPEIERLVLRDESLSFEEAEMIGLKTAVNVYAYRDKRLMGSLSLARSGHSTEQMKAVRDLITSDSRAGVYKQGDLVSMPSDCATSLDHVGATSSSSSHLHLLPKSPMHGSEPPTAPSNSQSNNSRATTKSGWESWGVGNGSQAAGHQPELFVEGKAFGLESHELEPESGLMPERQVPLASSKVASMKTFSRALPLPPVSKVAPNHMPYYDYATRLNKSGTGTSAKKGGRGSCGWEGLGAAAATDKTRSAHSAFPHFSFSFDENNSAVIFWDAKLKAQKVALDVEFELPVKGKTSQRAPPACEPKPEPTVTLTLVAPCKDRNEDKKKGKEASNPEDEARKREGRKPEEETVALVALARAQADVKAEAEAEKRRQEREEIEAETRRLEEYYQQLLAEEKRRKAAEAKEKAKWKYDRDVEAITSLCSKTNFKVSNVK